MSTANDLNFSSQVNRDLSGFAVVDGDGIVVEANEAFRDLCRSNIGGELIGKKISMTIRGILKGAKQEIKVWSADDIGVDKETVGLKASPTNVFKSFTPKPKGAGITVEGDTPKEKAANFVADLKAKHII